MKNQWVEMIEDTEKKLTEAYQEIIDNEYQDVNGWNYCIFCGEGSLKGYTHKEGCIVKKAEEWLEG